MLVSCEVIFGVYFEEDDDGLDVDVSKRGGSWMKCGILASN